MTALLAFALAFPPATASAATGSGPRVPQAGAAYRAGSADSPGVGGSDDFLNGDSCTSSTFCMAVGAHTLNGHTPGMSAMLSGTSWVAQPVPSPPHGANVFANEVSCASATNCLFVGAHYAGPHSNDANLAEAWNGTSWRIVADTGPAGAKFSLLTDVACPTTSFCLAIGQAGSDSRNQDTAYTWKNGNAWRRITVPHPSHARTSELGGLACSNAGNCMGVGNYTNASGRSLPFSARWHDGRWKLLTMVNVRKQHFTAFNGVSCPTSSRCVAVGNTEDETRGRFFHAVAETWTGGKWHLSTLTQEPSYFIGISCPSATHCYAAGASFPAAINTAHPLIAAWNGRTWTIQSTVQTFAPHHGDVLAHVSCVSRSRCEAVGYRYRPGASDTDLTLAETLAGSHWKLQTTPNP